MGSTSGQIDYLLDAKYGGSTRALAKDLGVSQRYVQLLRSGRRQPSEKVGNSLRRRATATYADRSRREAKADAKEWRDQGAGGFGTVQVYVDVLGSDIQIQGSPKIRGRSIVLNLTAEQAAELAEANSAAALHAVTESALLDYFNGVAPGYQRPTYTQFSPGDITFDMNGVDFQ